MSRIWGLRRRFRFPWRTSREIANDVDDEIQFHLDSRIEELVGQGHDVDEAARRARFEFGDLEEARAELKRLGVRTEERQQKRMILEEIWLDVKYSLRTLVKSPGFAAVAIGVLALGIGVNAAMFGLLNMLLLRPTGEVSAHRLVGVYSESVDRPGSYRSFSYQEYEVLRDRGAGFDELAAFNVSVVGITEGDVTTRSMSALVSPNFFALFGETLDQGRAFTAQEGRPGSGVPVAIVSHGFWTRRGAPAGFVGSTLEVNGQPLTVVGIASPGFTGATAVFAPDLWLPLGLYGVAQGGPMAVRNNDLTDPDNHALMLVGRLAEGRGGDAVQPELDALGAALQEAYPSADGARRLTASPLSRLSISTEPTDDRALIGPALMLMAMTGVVLLIACLNLANMFLARGASRQMEVAVRASLGGGRVRLLRQILTECLLLSLLGGVLGLGLAYVSSRVLFSAVGALLPFGLTLRFDLTPDVRVVAATALFCVVATLAFGLGPAFKVTGGDLVGSLKASLGAAGGRRSGTGAELAPRNLLIVAQIALSLALLSAGGLFLRAALQAARATPGFPLEGSILAELDPSLVGYGEEQTRDVYRRVVERLGSMPGVERVSFASIVPFGSVSSRRRVMPAGRDLEPEDTPSAYNYIVGADYFATLRMALLRGRELTTTETFGQPEERVAIIDEPLAEMLWPGEDALGRFVVVQGSADEENGEPMRVVGIAPGVRHSFFATAAEPHLYEPYGQEFTPNMTLHLRVAGGDRAAAALLGTVRDEIRAVDGNVPVVNLKTMVGFRDDSVFVWLVRAGAKVFSVLGAVALLLAVVGIYGVRSFLMTQRTREIGLRLALGATPAVVIGALMREGARVTIAGLGLGVVLSLAVARLLGSMLYGVSSFEPAVFLASILILAAAATLATFLPARRATRIAPTAALRQE